MDLIHLINNDDDETKSGKRGGLRFGVEGGSGLYVDFDSGVATLSNTSAQTSAPNNTYRSSGTTTTNWTTSMRIEKLDLYDLGGHATAPFEEQLVPKPRLRSASPPVTYRAQRVEQAAAPQVGVEELKKRIEGFGSGG